jgi:hypothetical protein
VQKIVEDLVQDANVLGAWVINGQHELAGAAKDPSMKTPRAYADSEAWVEVGSTQVFLQPVGSVMLVVLFDNGSSLGLVRLRVRKAKEAIIRELTQ